MVGRTVACAALTAALAPLLVPAGPARGPAGKASIKVGKNVQVSGQFAGVAHFECVVAADPGRPGRLLAGSMYGPKGYRWPQVVAYYSRDGGQTWRLAFERKGDPRSWGGDPAVAFGPDESAYFVSLSHFPSEANPGQGAKRAKPGDPDVGFLLFARSRDGGKTWGAVTKLNRWIDRPYLGVDCSGGPFRGRLYCSGNAISSAAVYTSRDGGRSFGSPAAWSPRPQCFGNGNPVVLSDGAVVVLYDGFSQPFEKKRASYVAVRRSTDGGATFGEERVVGPWAVRDAPDRCLPQLAADPGSAAYKDRLYAVWAEQPPGGFRILCSVSRDRGMTWSKPALLSEQAEAGPGKAAYPSVVPSVAVSKAGVVAVTWYDRRGLPPGGKGWNVRLRASRDGGATWLPSVQVNDVAADKGSVAHLGHTAGLAADARGDFHPVWIDFRTGTGQLWTAAVKVGG